MNDEQLTADAQERRDADDALYNTYYGAPTRPALTDEDEALYAAIYGPAGRTPLTDEDQQLYNSLIPEN